MKSALSVSRSWLAIVAAAVLLPLSVPAFSNVVDNGNFETSSSSLAPWSNGGAASQTSGGRNGSGNAVQFASTDSSGGFGSLSQTLTGLANGTYDLQFWLNGTPPAGEFLVEKTSNSAADIALTTGTADGDWTPYFGSFAAGGDFGLLFTVDTVGNTFSPGSGSTFNFKLDDVSLTLRSGNNVPEPGSLLLVGAALAGVALARRRKGC